MNSRLILKKLEESLDDIRSITRVFEHTAAKKMGVNRQEIAKLANHVKEAIESYSYLKIAEAGNKRNKEEILRTSYRAPKKKKVLILITSENKYFGNLINSMVKLFINEFLQGGADAIVIGEVGKELLTKANFNATNVIYFDFNDDKPDWNVITRVSEELGDYGEVIIFYGQYKSILTQDMRRQDIAKSVVVNNVPKLKKYDFEPFAGNSLRLLEKQIISSNFLQKLYETGLTKNAQEVKVLEIGAIAERINLAMGQLAKFKLRLNKDTYNRKQTQLYSSRRLWEKGGIFTIGKT